MWRLQPNLRPNYNTFFQLFIRAQSFECRLTKASVFCAFHIFDSTDQYRLDVLGYAQRHMSLTIQSPVFIYSQDYTDDSPVLIVFQNISADHKILIFEIFDFYPIFCPGIDYIQAVPSFGDNSFQILRFRKFICLAVAGLNSTHPAICSILFYFGVVEGQADR